MAKKSTGYIKVSRSFFDSPLVEDKAYSNMEMWLDLNIMANHSDQKKTCGNKVYTLKRGQLTCSQNQLADRWHCSRERVRRKLKLFEDLGLITIDCNQLPYTLLTLINYGVEQNGNGVGETSNETDNETTNETARETAHETTSETANEAHYKNDKNVYKNVIYE